jgi:hypothetical protein
MSKSVFEILREPTKPYDKVRFFKNTYNNDILVKFVPRDIYLRNAFVSSCNKRGLGFENATENDMWHDGLVYVWEKDQAGKWISKNQGGLSGSCYSTSDFQGVRRGGSVYKSTRRINKEITEEEFLLEFVD